MSGVNNDHSTVLLNQFRFIINFEMLPVFSREQRSDPALAVSVGHPARS